MRMNLVNLIILTSLVFYSCVAKADEPCEGSDCPSLKIDNIDLQHTNERPDESLDAKAINHEHKLKLKQKVVSKEDAKKNSGGITIDPNDGVKGKTIVEREQSKKAVEFKTLNKFLTQDKK